MNLAHIWLDTRRDFAMVIVANMSGPKANEAFLALEQTTAVRPLAEVVADAERAAITRALTESGGNREKAAVLLDVALRNLYYKIKK